MKKYNRIVLVALILMTLSVCVSCGGGGDGIEGSGLNGTVAIGKPIINAEVIIKGRSGKKITVLTGSDGKYQADVSELTAPYFLNVSLNQSRSLFSIAVEPGIANIHPFTDAVSRNWFRNKSRDIKSEFDSNSEILNPPGKQQVNNIIQSINNLLGISYKNYQIDDDFNFINQAFDANQIGFDKLLDNSKLTVVNNQLTLKIIEPVTQLENVILVLNLTELIALQDNESPTKPQGLQSFNHSETSLLLLWNPAQDNIGVAGYNIYRDGNLLSQTPFPIFSDTNLTANISVCYTIESVDGKGNVSQPSDQICVTAETPGQNNPPLAASNLQSSSNGQNSINLLWTPSSSDNILGYHIYRQVSQNNETRIATQISSNFQDSNLIENTEYCYRITAFNVTGNESDFSSKQCATTDQKQTQIRLLPTSNASPIGQTYTTPKIVTLTCTDKNNNNCETIYYTIDGSDVTINSPIYTSPININTTSTLKFFGLDKDNQQEPPKQEVYTINEANNNGSSIVQFSSNNYLVDESIAAAEIIVSRTGDTSQAISVNYSANEDVSSLNSALLNADFTAVSGTLNWAADETSNKVFYVPIKGDAKPEVVESIRLTLSGNSSNMAAGEIATSKISINDVTCNNTLTNNVTEDTIINETCTRVSSKINIRNANLTLSPGVTLVFDSGAGLIVDSTGSFTAEGSLAKPILLTSNDRTRGYWDGLVFNRSNSSRNILTYVTVEYGSGSISGTKGNLRLYGDSTSIERIKIEHSTFSDSNDYGIVFSQNTIVGSFENNTITRNKLGSIYTPADVTRYLTVSSSYTGNDIDFVEVASSKIINTSQTWSAINTPYLVDGLTVRADLTITAGSKLIFTDNSLLEISSDGSLNAIGTELSPILFTSKSETPGAWTGIRFLRSNDIKNVMDYVIVEYGGKTTTLGSGNIVLYGDSASTQRLKLTNSILRYSGSNGFHFYVNSNIIGFANNIISNNDDKTGLIAIASVPSLDKASTYTNNNTDYIELIGQKIETDQSWKKLNADYFSVGISLFANLIIESGTIIYFDRNTELSVNSAGSLTAIGDENNPIVFTSDSESPGDWKGIRFIRSNSEKNQLMFTEVHYAGQFTTLGEGAISLYGDSATNSRLEISDSLISNSENYAIWLHSTAIINDDASSVNTFTDNKFNEVFRK